MADNISDELSRNAENFMRLNEELDRLIGNYSATRKNTSGLSDAAKDLAQILEKTAQAEKRKTEESKQANQAALRNLKQSGAEFLAASKSYAEGVGKYGQVFVEAGDAVKNVTSVFGPLGKIVGYATQLLGKFVGEALKYNDVLYKNYTIMGQLGASANISSKDLLKLANNANFTSENLEFFSKTATGLGSTLVGLGGSASGGIKAFSELAESSDGLIAQFTRMGFSQEEVLEMQAKYADQVVKTGGAIGKTPRELAVASREYISNLQILGELTGIDVKKQQEAMDLALANENFNAYIADLERQRAETTDKAEKERLANIITSTKQYAAYIQATDDARTATAKLEIISNKTGEIYTANSAHLLTQNFEIEKITNTLKSGKFNAGLQAIQTDMSETSKVVKNTRASYGEALYSMGPASKALMEIVGYNIKASEKAALADKLAGMTEEQRENYLKKIIEKQRRIEQTSKDAIVETEADRRQAEIQQRKLEDTRNEMISELTSGFLQTFFRVMKQITETFTKFLEFLSPYVTKFSQTLNNWNTKIQESITKLLSFLPESIRPTAASQATAGAGFDMKRYLQATALVESGGRPAAAAPTSSARGMFQFTEGTWKETVREMGKGYTLQDRFDPVKSAEVMSYFTQKQKGMLEKDLGGPASSADVYMAHFLGIGGASKFLREMRQNPTAVAAAQFGKEASANPSIFYDGTRPRTFSEVYALMASKIGGAEKAVETGKWGGRDLPEAVKGIQAQLGGIFDGPKTGYPVTMHGREIVAPLDANSILAQLAQTPAADVKTSLQNQNMASSEMVSVLVDKLNTMIDKLDNSNDIQTQILTYARV